MSTILSLTTKIQNYENEINILSAEIYNLNNHLSDYSDDIKEYQSIIKQLFDSNELNNNSSVIPSLKKQLEDQIKINNNNSETFIPLKKQLAEQIELNNLNNTNFLKKISKLEKELNMYRQKEVENIKKRNKMDNLNIEPNNSDKIKESNIILPKHEHNTAMNEKDKEILNLSDQINKQSDKYNKSLSMIMTLEKSIENLKINEHNLLKDLGYKNGTIKVLEKILLDLNIKLNVKEDIIYSYDSRLENPNIIIDVENHQLSQQVSEKSKESQLNNYNADYF